MQDIHDLARRYQLDATYIGQAHYKAAELAARKQRRLAIPSAVLSAVVGTSIFATISLSPATGWKVIAGLLSLLAAAFAALQATLQYSDVAETHRTAGASYGAVRRELDMFLVEYPLDDPRRRDQAESDLQRLSKRLSELAADRPPIPDPAYQKAKQEIVEAAHKDPATSIGSIAAAQARRRVPSDEDRDDSMPQP